MEKAYLFEVFSKLYISTDTTSPGKFKDLFLKILVEILNFTMCAEMIDVFLDIAFIYGKNSDKPPLGT